MINKIKVILSFLGMGFIVWLMEQLKSGKKAKEQVIIDNYQLKKDQINDKTKDESIDKLISDTNSLYKSGGKSGQEDK
jgi:hypothetical protein